MSLLRIVAISDTHSRHHMMDIPDGDILVHSGDISKRGRFNELKDFNDFLGSLPHKHKVFIAGNHDFCFEEQPESSRAMVTNGIYLEDEMVEIEGIKIYGSPWTPWFFRWAFNLKRGRDIRKKWDQIPENLDILLTHGPPMGILDCTATGRYVGCEELKTVVLQKKPLYHIFGHIHEAYGYMESEHTTFLNVSSCDLEYHPVQEPMVFDLKR